MYYAGLRTYDNDDERTKRWKRRTLDDLLRLRAALRQQNFPNAISRAPGPDRRRLRIATWNLREFDTPNYGFRLEEAFYYIAEVISAFDLVALQEVRGDLSAFHRLMRILGPDWSAIMTDADESSAAHNERMVFVFDTTRVRFQGTAGEINLADDHRLLLPDSFDLILPDGVEVELPDGADLTPPQKVPSRKNDSGSYSVTPAALVDVPAGTKLVLPAGTQLAFKGQPDEFSHDVINNRIANKKIDVGEGKNRRFSTPVRLRWPAEQMELGAQQFARTPFIVYFQSEWMKIALCTVHIYFGDNTDNTPQMARRKKEIAAFTRALSRKARETGDSDSKSYFIALGDFNIKGRDHGTMEALVSNGFKIPDEILEIPAGTNVARDKYYDQIAFWMGEKEDRHHHDRYTRIKILDAGIFDVFKHVFRDGDDDPGGVDEAYFRSRMSEVGKSYSSYRQWRTHQISDHLPMWVAIETDFADAYLNSLIEDNGGST